MLEPRGRIGVAWAASSLLCVQSWRVGVFQVEMEGTVTALPGPQDCLERCQGREQPIGNGELQFGDQAPGRAAQP